MNRKIPYLFFKFQGYLSMLFLVFFLLVINACQSDFDIEGTYSEELIVYGLLNSQDSVHFIRISPSVLNGPGESLDKVIRDSSQSGFQDPLDIWVVKWGDKGQTDYPIPFLPNRSVDSEKDGPSFGTNTVYSSTRRIDPGAPYRLFVSDPTTHKTLTAICYTIDITNLHYQIENTYNSVTVDCLDSVFFYQTEMYFSFVEVSENDTTYCRIPLFKHTLTNETKKSGSTKVLSLERPDIMKLIGKSIKPVVGLKRYALKRPYEFQLALGDEVLFDYQNILNSTDQKYQSTQPITNIHGGKGIFSSVYRKSLGSLYMQDYWYEALSKNEFTRGLNFQPIPWNE